jgi:hemoglobin
MARVALRFDTPQSVGETPDGVRLDFRLQGTVDGPALKGKFPSCAAFLLIDVDGVGTINVRAPLLLNDGAVAELEATGRYDFGQDGYRRAAAGDLPDSALGWCPRFLTGHPRYLWLNRALFLGVGELRPRETRVDYDLFSLTSRALPTTGPKGATATVPRMTPKSESLYERLGGKDVIKGVATDFLDALLDSAQLNRQNPKVAVAHARLKLGDLREKGAELLFKLFCKLTGGPCEYTGRPLKEAHAHLDVTEADWSVMIEELVKVLDSHDIPKGEQNAFLAVVGTTKSDIVTRWYDDA